MPFILIHRVWKRKIRERERGEGKDMSGMVFQGGDKIGWWKLDEGCYIEYERRGWDVYG